MKVLTVESNGETLSLELSRPELSGLAVLYINGLGPVKADVVLDNKAVVDGGIFNSSRATTRNIVIGLQYYETNVFDLPRIRYLVSKFFPIKTKIKLIFDNGVRKAFVFGYVESNSPEIFSKQAGTVISIISEDSYFYDVAGGISSFKTSPGVFTFPFSNESLTTPLLTMGNIEVKQEIEINYIGESPIGFLLHIHINGSASSFSLISSTSLGVLGIDSERLSSFIGEDLTPGDDIWISTVIGKKYARLVRAGITYNILDCLNSNPEWFFLVPGKNNFVYTLGPGAGNIDIDISYNIGYEGM